MFGLPAPTLGDKMPSVSELPVTRGSAGFATAPDCGVSAAWPYSPGLLVLNGIAAASS
ncbi:MAG: hypothetical protein ABUL62_33970 [Myxococcales bacterium]